MTTLVPLQRIQFTGTDIAPLDMYYKRRGASKSFYLDKDEPLFIPRGEQVDFDTYFNILNLNKWQKYTHAGPVSLKVIFSGNVQVQLLSLSLNVITEKTSSSPLATINISSSTKKEAVISFPPEASGIVAFSVTAKEDSFFYAGEYCSEVAKKDINDISLALCVCTYKRESFVEKNLDSLNNFILNDSSSPLKDNLQIYISDNGKTLDIERLSSEKIHIFENINGGGAAGFTRTMIEAQRDKSITHCVLSDDDATLNYSSIERTFLFLRLLRDEFSTSLIGGAMLSLNNPSIMYANGESLNANWENINPKYNLNLSKISDVIKSEHEEYISHFAWWYCSIPVSLIKDKFAVPLFFQYDDVEFSLRNPSSPRITLPGVGLWHEEFDRKLSPMKNYYSTRNVFIARSFYDHSVSSAYFAKRIAKEVFYQLSICDYDRAKITLRAARDFLKGASWLMSVDQEKLNTDILNSFTKPQPISELPVNFSIHAFKKDLLYHESHKKTLLRKLLLNGLFFPPHRTGSPRDMPIIHSDYPHPALLFRRRRVLKYNMYTHKGIIVERSARETFHIIFSCVSLFFESIKKFKPAQKSYIEKHSDMISRKYWYKFLGIS